MAIWRDLCWDGNDDVGSRFKALYLRLERVQAMSVVSHCRNTTLYALSMKTIVAFVVGCRLGKICIFFHMLKKWNLHGQHASLTHAGLYIYKYCLTLIMSPLIIEHLDIVTQKFETHFHSVKLPCYYPYHP